jgi:uncharacterized GH25 family protein
MPIRNLLAVVLASFAAVAATAQAHDTWLETNTNLVRTGDAVHISLMLGNHGNEHRDYKIAGKASLDRATVLVTGPDGKPLDLKDRLVDQGYAPHEGHWTAKFVAAKSGLYSVVQTDDSVYRTTRSIRTARTFFVASPKLDYVQPDKTAFDAPLGKSLEIVPEAHPVLPMGPGTPIKVRLLYQGKPLAGEVVSFIPRGESLKEGFDDRYERKTDAEGRCSFTPKTGDWYLIAAHRLEPGESGDGYEKTKYAATLNVFVPEFCSCCE